MEKMKSRVRDGTGRLKERGGGERHAPAKPRLVAVLRSKLRFTRFLQVPTGSHCLSPSPLSFRLLDYLLSLSLYFPQVPTGSHCLSPPPSPSGYWIAYFPFLSTFPKCRRVHFIFLRPLPSRYWPTYSCFFYFLLYTLLNSFST